MTGAANEFVVWNTDATATTRAAPPACCPGTSNELEAVEANFGEVFSGAGPGRRRRTGIATNGTTTLVQVGNLFELNSAGGGAGPLLESRQPGHRSGQFGLAQSGRGDGRWLRGRLRGPAGANCVWNTDANGNYTSVAANTTSAPEVAGIEAAFGDANIAGVTGVPAATTATLIATNGVTTLDELEVNGSSQNGDVYELNPAGGKGGPLLGRTSTAASSQRASSPPATRRSGR